MTRFFCSLLLYNVEILTFLLFKIRNGLNKNLYVRLLSVVTYSTCLSFGTDNVSKGTVYILRNALEEESNGYQFIAARPIVFTWYGWFGYAINCASTNNFAVIINRAVVLHSRWKQLIISKIFHRKLSYFFMICATWDTIRFLSKYIQFTKKNIIIFSCMHLNSKQINVRMWDFKYKNVCFFYKMISSVKNQHKLKSIIKKKFKKITSVT